MERTAPETWKIAVLTGGRGRGSNLRALHRVFNEEGWPIKIAFAVACHPEAPVVRLCAELGIPCHVLAHKDCAAREKALLELCQQEKIDLIALAGYLKLLSGSFLEGVRVPVLNIHPALLPDFGGKGMYGSRVHEAVFEAGEKQSGATVHLVDPIYDHGEIVLQDVTDISNCACPDEVAERVLEVEHRLYARAIYTFLSRLSK